MKKTATLKLATAAVVGACYAVLTMILAPISYGAVQFRVSEALCILPFFMPCTAWGLFGGCIIANLLTGNIFDIVFGSLATLAAALITAEIGRRGHDLGRKILACLMPVLFNAVIIGIEIAVMFPDPSSSAPIWLACITNGISVGIGELISCTILGVLLVKIIESSKALNKIFAEA